MFHTATDQEIKKGKVTDVYFLRTLEVLRGKKIDKWVKAEFIAKSLPINWEWGVLAGVEEVMNLCKGMKVNLEIMREGTFFRPYQPVLTIEGMYTQFVLYETALLGLICQSSGVATQSARCRKLAGNRTITSFGARRMHPSISPMIERSAYIGGCDGVSVVPSAEMLGIEPSGTMPHSLILVLGDTVKAVEAFHDIINRKIKRVALIDTFNDEKFEAVRVAKALGRNLFAVRLDTPLSRRGDFGRILEEVRWELDLRGYQNIKLIVSGGIDETNITELNPFVDGYGIGTKISNAPVVDFSMDIIEIEGEPISKRGKMGGGKEVLRCSRCQRDEIQPLLKNEKGREKKKRRCPCGGNFNPLLKTMVHQGKATQPFLSPHEIRKYVLKQVSQFSI